MEAKYVGDPMRMPMRWMEPILHMAPEDQEDLMKGDEGPLTRLRTLDDCTLSRVGLMGGAERTLPASRYLKLMTTRENPGPTLWPPVQGLWTHLLVANEPPQELGFEYEGQGY
eukprot:532257-Prymnesium_polylepis.1